MEDSNYDEFGNYIGPEIGSDSEGENEIKSEDKENYENELNRESDEESADSLVPMQESALTKLDEVSANQVVLHEDKQYYPTANEIYGEDVEALVMDEDAQPLTEPIVKPIKVKKFSLQEEGLPETIYKKEFLLELGAHPEFIRNIGIIGHLHHGKTALVDMLINETHSLDLTKEHMQRYTDIHNLERSRGVSIKSTPISLLLKDFKEKSYLFNIIDTPGHVNFSDEVTASLRLTDGVIIVVDAIEGVMLNTEKLIHHALANNQSLTLIINKVDRLILELKLPLNDAYFKLKHTIEEVNSIISKSPFGNNLIRLSPELGNVAFASSSMGWCFTLESFAKLYSDYYGGGLDSKEFSKRLWGDIYLDHEKRTFHRKPSTPKAMRTFIIFILAPLYKIYSQSLSLATEDLKCTLASVGIYLKPKQYDLDAKELLKIVLAHFFGTSSGLVEMIKQHIPSPLENGRNKVETTYTGPSNSLRYKAMVKCDPEGPLMLQITKLYSTQNAQGFHAFGRVLSGTLRRGMKVRVLGEKYTAADEEDSSMQTVEEIWVHCSRYFIPTEKITPGNLVLISGVDSTIVKTATITSLGTYGEDSYVFRPLKFATEAVMKVAIEPINPTELPKMLDGLRRIDKSYSIAKAKTEESGEHVILGTGELYMDCILHDLRRLYSEIEIKVSDPIVQFCETVSETSAIQCQAETPNKKNKLTMISEPLPRGMAQALETSDLSGLDKKALANHFTQEFKWDTLSARSIWAFGPEMSGSTNMLLDETLPDEVDPKTLRSVKDYICQGFRWAQREGPLCDEPIRSVKYRLLDAVLAQDTIGRGAGQIIPTARRVCFSAFLTASPRLLEPIYHVEIQAPADCVAVIYQVLARRRGHVTSDQPKAGSPLYTIHALIPVIDASGFETDLRTHTQGQAFCQLLFEGWEEVPGDPLDTSIVLRPLEPAPPQHLARDFMLKSRRRKGLSDDVSITKFFDDPMLAELLNGLKA